MMRLAILVLLGLVLLGTSVLAQQPAKKTIPALPAGKTKVYRAIVMKVVGVAQSRAKRGQAWKALKVNDVLHPGVAVRTGRKSMVALRVGANATLLIDRQTRIAIPEIIQDGEKLRTRVSLKWGRTEVKVNKVGRLNDFEVATPSATLAVRGTAFRVQWDVVQGHRAMGVRGNRIHAIHVEYLQKVKVALSKADTTSERFPLPALDAWYETDLEPLKGAFSPEELENDRMRPIDLGRPHDDTGLRSANQQRGQKSPARAR